MFTNSAYVLIITWRKVGLSRTCLVGYCMGSYTYILLSIVLKCQWVLYSSAIEYYTQVPLSTMLKCHWVLYSSAIEYYTQVPLSTILKCHWVLYSCAIEYYTHVPLSTMLMCHWVLCSCAIEYYAQVLCYLYWIEWYLLVRIWVYEIIFYWNKLFHSPQKWCRYIK